MAVLALGFVGTAIGGGIGGTILGVAASTIGGFIGSTIGSFVDNMLFPQKQEGPRLADLSVQTSTLGNPIPLLFGPENRIAGNVIWSTGLLETAHTQKAGKGGPSVSTTQYTYRASFAVALCEGEIVGLRKIWANGKLIYDASLESGPLSDPPGAQDAGLWSDMRVYPGTFTQNPDPTIEAFDGVGEVQAYRGTAYVVFADFQLADYGNRLPQLEFLIEKDTEIALGQVIAEIVERCGLDPNTISTSGLSGNVRGYAIGNLSSGVAALQPLALVYNFDCAQVAGALRFVPRGNAPVAVIPPYDMAAYATGDRPDVLAWSRNLETAMPREASLQFRDPDRDYQVNSQAARRQAGSADSNLSSQIPIVVTVDEARQLCDRMLWEAWVGRQTALASVSDRWINVDAGKVYLFETPAGLEPLRLRRKTRGANGVIELELMRDRAAVYQSTARGIPAPVPGQEVNVTLPTDLFLFDAPILEDQDDDPGFYFVVDGQGSGWRGSTVLRSEDAGATYDTVAPMGRQGIIGEIEGGLPDGVTVVFDEVNIITVQLRDTADELESVTELDVLNGKNAAWVGPADGSPGEVLQYKTATLIAPGRYELSGLLRGRLGTEWATSTHGSGDMFVKLDDGNLARADYSITDWNKDRIYKAVTLLQAEADADQVPFTNSGEGKRPLSPVNIVGDNLTADLVITWDRRSRLRSGGIAGPVPLGEVTEAYEIDVLDGPGGPLLRTLTSTSQTVTYTAAMMTADGVAPGDTVGVEVYQMSDVRGRGRAGTAELLA
jgi:hypothetical protein